MLENQVELDRAIDEAGVDDPDAPVAPAAPVPGRPPADDDGLGEDI